MKKILKSLLFLCILLLLIYIGLAPVSVWFQNRKLQREQLERIVEITRIPEFKCMRVLYYFGPNSWAWRKSSMSRFIFFSPTPTPYFSGLTPPLKIDAKENIGKLTRNIISKALGADIGELRGSISFFQYRSQGHQLDISVSETKDGFYIEADDILNSE